MEWEEVEAFWLAITKIEAQNLLQQMKIADFPNMKPMVRDRLHFRLYSQAYPEQNVSVSPQGLGAFL